MSLLSEFYDGNIIPSQKYIKKGGEYYKQNTELCDTVDKFIMTLNKEQKELSEKISDISSNLCYISEKEAYINGFCVGAQMILEIINLKSENFT